MATRRRRAQPPPEPKPRPESTASRGVWLAKDAPVDKAGVVWLKRPMPDGQWPPDQRLPRDDSWSWWVRAHCGHPGGTRQFAFYEEKYADIYGHVFRENPCYWTRCPEYRLRAAGR